MISDQFEIRVYWRSGDFTDSREWTIHGSVDNLAVVLYSRPPCLVEDKCVCLAVLVWCRPVGVSGAGGVFLR